LGAVAGRDESEGEGDVLQGVADEVGKGKATFAGNAAIGLEQALVALS
jgi:hypothetical protein